MPSRTVRTIADVPPIGDLYRAGRLPLPSDSSSSSPFHKPSQDINRRVSLLRTDITALAVDAIVNAAKNSLRGGGGVDGAIHAAAGPGLVRECIARYPDGCETGDAVITAGHGLPARNVIHTVGPVYRGQAASEPLLRSCYQACLRVAVDNGCATVAFSGISTGVYGYPSDKAAHVACGVVRDFLERQDAEGKIQRVIFVTFLDKDVNAYNSILP
ncbi:A1pp-domain-containing protein [Trichoderma citrinoviride]|uniref:A1pp-domain-containing protein n=1 Tax=Trichoderma citrinoviride TaxID=58853 RepID=A0A2T4BEB3_9HYPO|nr:A1pp-domain-containing protein [Trichoderma citrinoviride]PTB67598.1 A1pp-domain-containing protein [Trichoderma citrinoviride]